jgi:hypothetical protein
VRLRRPGHLQRTEPFVIDIAYGLTQCLVVERISHLGFQTCFIVFIGRMTAGGSISSQSCFAPSGTLLSKAVVGLLAQVYESRERASPRQSGSARHNVLRSHYLQTSNMSPAVGCIMIEDSWRVGLTPTQWL